MPVKVDGTNGVLQAYDFQVFSTGFAYTFPAGTTSLIAAPAGTLATGTITMPVSPADGMVVTIESTQQVTAVTVQGNTGQSIVGAPSQLVPNQPLAFVYRQSNTTWYPIAGGAGRATTLASGTAVASTSGTSIDFTGIPSWVRRITVMLSGVSTNGGSSLRLQIGAGAIETSGYNGGALIFSGTGGAAIAYPSAAGFELEGATGSRTASTVRYGSIVLMLVSGNTWLASSTLAETGTTIYDAYNGNKTLSGTLDRVRITTVNGTDVFDAGTINILYE